MKSVYLSLLIVVCLGFSAESAIAAKRSKKKKAQERPAAVETYSAEDPDPMERSATAISVDQQPGTAPPQGHPIQESQLPQASEPRWLRAAYDSVPASQADAVSKRLRIVDEILRRYGRAYDYRALTVKDLEKIMAELDAKYSTTTPVLGDN